MICEVTYFEKKCGYYFSFEKFWIENGLGMLRDVRNMLIFHKCLSLCKPYLTKDKLYLKFKRKIK